MGFFKKHAPQTIEVGGVKIISDYDGDPIDGWCRAFAYTQQNALGVSAKTAPTPHEFFMALQADLPESIKVTVTICREANGFVAHIVGGASEEEQRYSAQISVAPQHFATLSRADAAPQFLGQGVMKCFFGNLVNNYLLPLSNVSTINVGADNPYSWILYAFLPEPKEWQQKIVPAIASQFDLVKHKLASGIVAEIDELLRSPNPASLRPLAERRDVLVNHQPLAHFLLSHVQRWTGHLKIRDDADLAYFNRHVHQCRRPEKAPIQDITAGAMPVGVDANGHLILH